MVELEQLFCLLLIEIFMYFKRFLCTLSNGNGTPLTKYIDKLQTVLNRLGEWAVENEMKINPGKSKAISFIKARAKERMR